MSLLTLKDIGKIYVSDGNVAVGIRGVNLSFDRGEFVAITGQSGSGKSTLLNVISGMDTYEEGELYIEGETTSHYLQPEWEEYRKKYISFIFQDYNIIESFTVLQNVELALMHIESKKERRRRALELIDRVGLTPHIKHKGSKLSGGQKQRTVIARALAKDSPIILADEPTGNLDSASSVEIIKLLEEVSRDKLLIVVTHNFDQVESCSTRHIRVFDGAIESDVRLSPNRYNEVPDSEVAEPHPDTSDSKKPKKKNKNTNKNVKNGITLGRSIFTSKPKLSFFLCMLMIVGALSMFFVTSLCGDMMGLFEKNYMFEHIDGRVVMTKQSGEPITDAELAELVTKHSALDSVHYDIMLDGGYYSTVGVEIGDKYYQLGYAYGEDYGTDIVGRYPKTNREALLYLPISCLASQDEGAILGTTVDANGIKFTVTGAKYYYDNNLTPKIWLTKEGIRTATSAYYINQFNSGSGITLKNKNGDYVGNYHFNSIVVCPEIEGEKAYINSSEYQKNVKNGYTTTVGIDAYYQKFHSYSYMEDMSTQTSFSKTLTDSDLISQSDFKSAGKYPEGTLLISIPLMNKLTDEFLSLSYRQASLFFENDTVAKVAAEKLTDEGYIAVPSYTTYTPSADEAIASTLMYLMSAMLWIVSIIFLAFFINLCTSRTIGAFKSDMAIMRSMGIPVKAIRIGMYVRMLISLIPAYVFVAVCAMLIFTVPLFNGFFSYLYAWQYALIIIGLLLLTVMVTHKQIKKLFGESVKKSLRGGHAE